MECTRTDTVIDQYGKFSPMSLNEAGAMAHRVFGDCPASREEAEALLAACGLFEAQDAAWRHIVMQEVGRTVMHNADGELQAGVEDWLIASLATSNLPDLTLLELVQSVIAGTVNATERLGRLGLGAALRSMKAVQMDSPAQKAQTV
jgi:hypothetical protein